MVSPERLVPSRDWSCLRSSPRTSTPEQRQLYRYPLPQRITAHEGLVQQVRLKRSESERRPVRVFLSHALRDHGMYTHTDINSVNMLKFNLKCLAEFSVS